MNPQQRLGYIFNNVDNRTGKRFDWIHAIINDIQSLIDGSTGFKKGNIIPTSGRDLGGGNVSISLLVCTGLELVSALHAGKTAYPPFTGYNATDNVGHFITNFFPIHAQKIPRLIWEGVRNGVDHLFIPYSMTCGQVSIDFKFVMTPPSEIIKDNINSNMIIIRINSIEFCDALRSAINNYGSQLKTDQGLQINFINAWESIKPKSIDNDFQKSIEVSYLLNELKQANNIGLFQD